LDPRTEKELAKSVQRRTQGKIEPSWNRISLTPIFCFVCRNNKMRNVRHEENWLGETQGNERTRPRPTPLTKNNTHQQALSIMPIRIQAMIQWISKPTPFPLRTRQPSANARRHPLLAPRNCVGTLCGANVNGRMNVTFPMKSPNR
jgi:hypothetical protein